VEKSSSTFSFRRVPRGFLLLLILILAFEVCVLLLPDYVLSTPPYSTAFMRWKGSVVDDKNEFDLLLLGDCMGWAGFRPVVFEELSGLNVFNMAVDVEQTYLMTYVLLSRYLKNCRTPPKLVLFQVSAHSLLAQELSMNRKRLRSAVLPYFRVDSDFLDELLPSVQRDYAHYRVLTIVPSLKKQFFFYNRPPWYVTAWSSSRAKYDHFMDYHLSEKGFFNEDLDPLKKPVSLVTSIPKEMQSFRVCEGNLKYFHKIMDLLENHNTAVVVCSSPIREDEAVLWDACDLENRLNELIKVNIHMHKNVLGYWNMWRSVTNIECYADHFHLNLSGANLYTEQLAARANLIPVISTPGAIPTGSSITSEE
jgi:hypothetical protein